MKTIRLSDSDVSKLRVERSSADAGVVFLEVFDANDGGVPLITASMNREQATRTAQAILAAAGVFPSFFDKGGE